MPLVNFFTHDGAQYEVEAITGQTLMEAARENGIDGILAECGGGCSCATCHCYIDDAWIAMTGTPSADEDGMLDCVLDREAGSRLSCQITLTEEMDGLKVRLPESQL